VLSQEIRQAADDPRGVRTVNVAEGGMLDDADARVELSEALAEGGKHEVALVEVIPDLAYGLAGKALERLAGRARTDDDATFRGHDAVAGLGAAGAHVPTLCNIRYEIFAVTIVEIH